ncbi:MAG: FHA domain-containing protein [Candidatus Binataceae bacterium]
MRARLVAVGDSSPREFHLDRDRVSLGSAPDNDFVVVGQTVSRHHATLERRDGVYAVADAGSTNGTFLNGRRVGAATAVSDGDELRVGAVRYRFEDDAAAARGLRPPSSLGRARAWRLVPLALLVAAFAATLFVINFSRLETAGVGPTSSATSAVAPPVIATPAIAPAVTPIAAAAATPVPSPAPDTAPKDWLAALNKFRNAVGVADVNDNPLLSSGCAAHSRYIVKNFGTEIGKGLGGVIHTEDSAKPWFTADGLTAARNSDVDEMWDPGNIAAPSWAIDNWMQGPFHRLSMLNPSLRSVGYGHYCEKGYCVATLDVRSDAGGAPSGAAPLPKPVEFPPDGGSISTTSFTGEWPNPLTSCPGYVAPAGYAITLQLGARTVPAVTSYLLTRRDVTSQNLDACAITADSYSNPDPVARSVTRGGLREYGAIVIMPRQPLAAGDYAVAITASGQSYAWSFAVKP